MIRCVIFDIDGTLYSYDEAHAVAFAALTAFAEKELGLEKGAFPLLHKQAQQLQKQRLGLDCAAIHSRLIRYQILLEGLGLPIAHAWTMEKLYWSQLIQAATPSPGAVECIRQLKEKGLRIGIATDMTAGWQYAKLEKLEILPYVDFMVTSEEVLEEKPSPRLFRLCAEKSGCTPEECILVGDNVKKDMEGAENLGMVPVWYNPQGRSAPSHPPFTIQRMDQLIPLLSQLQ